MLEQELAWLEGTASAGLPGGVLSQRPALQNIIYDSSKGTASRPRGGRAPAAPSAAWGVAPQGGCWARSRRPSAVESQVDL